jgi:hypothetical protein
MAMPMTKVSVGKSGYGAAHASYITRMSALESPDRDKEQSEKQPAEQISLLIYDRADAEPTVSETLNDSLNERALKEERSTARAPARDADPIWTWNAPDFLTGERHGAKPERPDKSRQTVTDKSIDPQATDQKSQDKLTLAEKVENIKLHFRSREEFERRKGGRTLITGSSSRLMSRQPTSKSENSLMTFLARRSQKQLGSAQYIETPSTHTRTSTFIRARLMASGYN